MMKVFNEGKEAFVTLPSIPPPVRSDWMGCFTADVRACNELFHLGVLVWLIQHNFTITPQTIIETSVRYIFPDHIVRSMYSEGGKGSHSFIVLDRGPGGYLCHVHTHHYYTPPVESSTTVP